MEWCILFTMISLYSIEFFRFAKEYLKKSEPRGPFQRPMRMREGLMMDQRIRQFIAALHENDNDAMKRGLIPEKVNWKKEGF